MPVIKEKPIEIDGRVMSSQEFVKYVEGKDFGPQWPNRIFLHHTWKPRKEEWRGKETLLAIKGNYERYRWTDAQGNVHEGWTAGPHLFAADDGIWLFTDLAKDGVGVAGHNHLSLHLEMVGDYDQEQPGGATLANTVAALGILHERLGLDPKKLLFHRDYSTKSCPGHAVRKEWIIPQVEAWMAEYRQERERTVRDVILPLIQEKIVPSNPGTALVKKANQLGLLGALSDEISIEIEDKLHIVQFFVEALIVPVPEWDKVKRLAEME